MQYMSRSELSREAYQVIKSEREKRGDCLPKECPENIETLLSMVSLVVERRILEHFERDPHPEPRAPRGKKAKT